MESGRQQSHLDAIGTVLLLRLEIVTDRLVVGGKDRVNARDNGPRRSRLVDVAADFAVALHHGGYG